MPSQLVCTYTQPKLVELLEKINIVLYIGLRSVLAIKGMPLSHRLGDQREFQRVDDANLGNGNPLILEGRQVECLDIVSNQPT